MMLPYFSEEFLARVKAIAEREHRTRYEQNEPWVHSLPGASSGIRESQIEIVELPELVCEPDARTESDAANAIALYESLRILTPVQASDERLWSCLAHTHYWRYTRLRWQGAPPKTLTALKHDGFSKAVRWSDWLAMASPAFGGGHTQQFCRKQMTHTG